MGRLIPAGTGFGYYKGVRIEPDDPPPPPQPALDELDLEHELEYFSEADGRSESVIGALKALGALGSGQNDRASNKED